MRYLNKVIFLNSAHIPYAEIRMDGNVHFIGTQGVGKSTLLRAILFFYNADKLHLGIPKEKQNFDAFYLPYANSYIVYEVVRENSAYSVVVSKSMGRATFRLIDAPYRKAWFVNDRHEVSADWSEVRTRILESDARCTITPLVTSYEMFRDIIFGNNRKPDMVSYRKFAIVESSKYQNIPRTIQHVFLNSRLDADFVKDTIIQSMNEEDVSIDLTYYRSQIEAFEQEYDDVMRWLRPNKNGEIVVRKQAEQVIQRYRSLLYSQKQLEEGRAELNYAEKAAHDMLPVLEEQIQEAEEKRARLVRLVGEERGKYSAERDKLVRREGAIADDLKRIREKRLYYEKEGIEEVMRRVAGEAALLHEQDSLKQTYAELTATYRDVLQKYDLLVGKVEAAFTAFENERRKAVLARENELNVWRNELYARYREQEVHVRNMYEERQKTWNENRIRLTEEISALRQQKIRIQLTCHFEKETGDYQEQLDALKDEERQTSWQVAGLKLTCDQLRQKCSDEMKESEWQFKQEAEELVRRRTALDEEIQTLTSLLGRWKGSFCEWLDAHKPGWQETIGKVADEELILYAQDLHPVLAGDSDNTLFGVRVELSGVAKELRTPARLKEELAEKEAARESYVRELAQLNGRREETLGQIKKKYNRQIREVADKQYLLEAQLQQIPARRKYLQAELTSWQRKEAEWKREQTEQVELQLAQKSQEQVRWEDEDKRLRAEKEKRLKQLAEELRKTEKAEEEVVRQETGVIHEEITRQRIEMETKKAELRRSQAKELEGSGADMSVITSYEKRMADIRQELEYIVRKRSLVSDFEKDKREYFDWEPQLRNEKKTNDTQLEDLENKYKLRMERLLSQQSEEDKILEARRKEHTDIHKDLASLKAFRADEDLCPSESYTSEMRPTRKSCGTIIGDLKSLIISIHRELDQFKRAVNAFHGNFTAKNTFHFPETLVSDSDFYDFAANLCEFVEDNKIVEYQTRISERYTNIIQRISKETGDLTQHESEIQKTIRAINEDFVRRNFAGVIRGIELRTQASDDKLMQLLVEIKQFNEEHQFNMGALDLFSQDSRMEVNEKAVKYLYSFSRQLRDNPSRKSLVLSDTFNLQFRVKENDNDTGWTEKIANVGSDGTDILVKAMVNIMLINVFKEKASRKFGDFRIHCMMGEIGKLHPNNVKGILAFANCRNIVLVNSSPTTYNVEDYRYTYLLSKDAQSFTQVVPLLTRKQ